MRIMYVEDNMVNLALVERVARMGGHTIVSYTNGEEALDALQTDNASLILMDIELDGDLDGTEVVAKLRERGDKRPIIAVTAYAMTGDMERIMSTGSDGYLPKPIPIAELLEIFAKYDPENMQPEPSEETEDTQPTAAISPQAVEEDTKKDTQEHQVVSNDEANAASPTLAEANEESAEPTPLPVVTEDEPKPQLANIIVETAASVETANAEIEEPSRATEASDPKTTPPKTQTQSNTSPESERKQT